MRDFFEVNQEENLENKLKWYWNEIEGCHYIRAKEEEYNVYEKEIKEIKRGSLKNEELKRLYDLLKANLYLRRGHSKYQVLGDGKADYLRALQILRGIPKKNGNKNTVDLLIYLSLAKYFRNMGHCDKRSNYSLAMQEFKKLENLLDEKMNAGKKLDFQEMYIYLDTKVNIARIKKNKYRYDEAKKELGSIIVTLVEKNINPDYKMAVEKLVNQKDENDLYIDVSKCNKLNRILEWSDSFNYYDDYLLEALVQLAIVYRKKREFASAELICKTVGEPVGYNVDFKNNLAACLRKRRKLKQAINILKEDDLKEKNRFASITYWKCIIDQAEISKSMSDEDKQEFQLLSDKHKCEKDWRFLMGRNQERLKNFDNALEIYRELYNEFPHLDRGSIALKAYYSMAKCYLAKNEVKSAKVILEEILGVDEDDVLAKIDLGWCWMKMGNYDRAIKNYLDLLKINTDNIDTSMLSQAELPITYSNYDKVRIFNNLGRCYLEIGKLDEAKILFEKVKQIEKNNVEALKYLFQFYYLNLEKNLEKKNYQEAKHNYEQAENCINNKNLKEGKDKFLVSNKILLKSKWIEIEKGENGEDKTKYYPEYIMDRLLYYPEFSYTFEACRAMAKQIYQYIKERDTKINLNDNEIDFEKRNIYRIFSRMRIWEDEKICNALLHYVKSNEFKCFCSYERGEILNYLILIYGEILEIKKLCQYNVKEKSPVHYTTYEVLKKLVEKDAKLRLWNSAYMNDPLEGAFFLKIIKMLRNDNNGCSAEINALSNVYFPNLMKDSEFNHVSESGVFITSLSEQMDDLRMWIAYGDKANGCNIAFANSFFDYTNNSNMWDLPQSSQNDYSLYKVQYIDVEALNRGKIKILENDKFVSNKESDNSLRIEENITNILYYLRELESILEKIIEQKKALKISVKATMEVVIEVLNEVRFLFKHNDFQYENEIRVIQNSSKNNFEQNCDIPRAFINIEKDIEIETVQVGPKVEKQKYNDTKAWLDLCGKVGKVIQSERFFR